MSDKIVITEIGRGPEVEAKLKEIEESMTEDQKLWAKKVVERHWATMLGVLDTVLCHDCGHETVDCPSDERGCVYCCVAHG